MKIIRYLNIRTVGGATWKTKTPSYPHIVKKETSKTFRTWCGRTRKKEYWALAEAEFDSLCYLCKDFYTKHEQKSIEKAMEELIPKKKRRYDDGHVPTEECGLIKELIRNPIRKFDCLSYEDCLMTAIKGNNNKFNCMKCKDFRKKKVDFAVQ